LLRSTDHKHAKLIYYASLEKRARKVMKVPSCTLQRRFNAAEKSTTWHKYKAHYFGLDTLQKKSLPAGTQVEFFTVALHHETLVNKQLLFRHM
jgi:hypothetical protein